jgi:hypothetical protein
MKILKDAIRGFSKNIKNMISTRANNFRSVIKSLQSLNFNLILIFDISIPWTFSGV